MIDRLAARPFTLAEALRAGMTARQLQGLAWRRIAPGTYVSAAVARGPLVELEAARLRVPPAAPFAGRTAGWLHGLDVEPCSPVEVIVPEACGISARVGLKVSRARLEPGELATVATFPVTSGVRTVADLARRSSLVEAVVVVDAALRAGLVTKDGLMAWHARHRSERGTRQLERAVDLADAAAESPMETRLRVHLALAGLVAEVQCVLHDATGEAIARTDLYYPQARLAVEYDGRVHNDSLEADARRQNRILAAGYELLRFTSTDMKQPQAVVAQVREALRRRERRRSHL